MRSLFVLPALAAALATPPAAATTWLCGLSGNATQIVCLADDAAEAAPADGAAEASPTVVRGTRFPLDAQRLWVVDLWSPATDQAGVEHLARATMCYRSPGCSVVWRDRPTVAARLTGR